MRNLVGSEQLLMLRLECKAFPRWCILIWTWKQVLVSVKACLQMSEDLASCSPISLGNHTHGFLFLFAPALQGTCS